MAPLAIFANFEDAVYERDPDCFPADFVDYTWALSQSEAGDVWFMELHWGSGFDFYGASEACRAVCKDCTIAAILNSHEQDAIQTIYSQDRNAWIGGLDLGWLYWVTDGNQCLKKAEYFNWAEGNPSNDEEDCVHLMADYHGKWNDNRCAVEVTDRAICQYR